MKAINDILGDIPHIEFDFIADWNSQKQPPSYGR